MKTINLCLFLFFINNLMAQIDTSIVYPMQIGNYWEYWDNVGSGARYAESIVRDTIMPNGRKYFLFRDCDYYFQTWDCYEERYLRIDSNRYVYQYQYENPDCQNGESLIYDFFAPDSTFWFRCNFIQGLFWGLYRSGSYSLPFEPYLFEAKTFADVKIDSTVLPPDTLWDVIGRIKVAKGIGKVDMLFELAPWYVLVGTILNGIKYGITTSIPDIIAPQNPNESIAVFVFPNPFNSNTKVILKNSINQQVEIDVYNVMGELIQKRETNTSEHNSLGYNLDLAEYPSGIYLLLIKTKGGVKSVPIIQLK